MLSETKRCGMLDFVAFNSLTNWSVQYLRDPAIRFNGRYRLMRIGDFLKRNKTSVVIQDSGSYKRATIRVRNGGIHLRDTASGVNIGTKKQFMIRSGQFLLSKIDARNGAFGVVPDELDGGIITGNFWTFDVDHSIINPHYLTLLTTTGQFIEFCGQASNGTTNRHYLQEPMFLNIKVPVPTMEEQNRLVDEYNSIISSVRMEEMRLADISAKATSGLRHALGSPSPTGSTRKQGINLRAWSSIGTWSVTHILHAENSPFGISKYPLSRLSDLAHINPRTDLSMLEASDKLSFIPMEDISESYGEWTGTRTGIKENSKGHTKFQNGDIIWARITPCMQNGKSALLHDLTNGKGYGSTEFHVIRLKTAGVLPEYIHILLRHPDILSDATRFFTGSAGQQRVPASYLENLTIPVPPLEVQKRIFRNYTLCVNQVRDGYRKIDGYKTVLCKNLESRIFE